MIKYKDIIIKIPFTKIVIVIFAFDRDLYEWHISGDISGVNGREPLSLGYISFDVLKRWQVKQEEINEVKNE